VDVYELAEYINRDFEDIIKQYGSESISPVVKKVRNYIYGFIDLLLKFLKGYFRSRNVGSLSKE
jgi:hypothetical protein